MTLISRWSGVCAVLLCASAVSMVSAQVPSGGTGTVATRLRDDAASRGTDTLLSRLVTIQAKQVKVRQAVDLVAAAAHVFIQYRAPVIEAYTIPVNVDLKAVPLREAMARVLAGTTLRLTVPEGTTELVIVDDKRAASMFADGSVGGTVTDGSSNKPLVGAIVSIARSNLSTRTANDGTFRLAKVSPGKHQLEVRRLGYRTYSVAIDVRPDTILTVAIKLTTAETRLSDVVTTATGDQRQREVPNAVARLDVQEIMRTTPIRTLTDLLADRVPGVQVSRASGEPGAPVRIRIRGIASATVQNDPIIILDGIRINPGMSDSNVVNRAIRIDAQPATVASRIDDIDPNAIETIEVLRGPSASALYGTDAANGVIIIKTRRGTSGRPRVNLNLAHDWTSVPTKFPPIYKAWGTSVLQSVSGYDCTLMFVALGICTQDSLSTFNPRNSTFTSDVGSGSNTVYSTTVSGGVQRLQYSLTGSYGEQYGADRLSEASGVRLRLVGQNVGSAMKRPTNAQNSAVTSVTSFQPREGIDLGLTLGGSWLSQHDNRALLQRLTARADDTIGFRPFDYALSSSGSKAVGLRTGLTNNMQLASWLTTNVVVGLDHSVRNDRAAYDPFNCPPTGDCLRDVTQTARALARMTSDEYSARLNFGVTQSLASDLLSRTSFGGHYNRHNSDRKGSNFSNITVGQNGVPDSTPPPLINITEAADAIAGWYLEESISFKDRLFVTGAVARDAGSAFGRDEQAPWYPRLGVSWVASDEPFFKKNWLVDRVRLRAAYGQSGVQPRRLDAGASYIAMNAVIDGQVVPSYELSSTGNYALKPERSTETEVGFDADFLNDRANVVATLYRKQSKNALISRDLGISVPAAQLSRMENIGAVANRGFELSVQGRLVDYAGWLLTTTVGASMNDNKVVTLGPGVLPFGDSSARIVVGYPVFGRWQKPVIAAKDVDGNGIIDPDEVIFGDTSVYVGSTQPRYTMQYSASLTVPGGFNVTANLSYTGAFTQAQDNYNRRGLYDSTSSRQEQAYAMIAQYTGDWQTISVLRLNSVMVGYALPVRLARRLRASSALMTLSGTNLGMWTKYRGADPSVNSSPIGDGLRDNGSALPLTRNYSLGMRLGF